MRRASPQGYGGRRACGYGGAAGTKSEMGSIWEVVSALAQALTDARNQLVTLMQTSQGDAVRMTGGVSRRISPARTYLPSLGGTGVRNVHRGHAHGHVAFGLNTEYRLHPTPTRARAPAPRPMSVEMMSSQAACRPSPGRCTHPLHRMSPARNPSPRRPMAPGNRASQCDRLSRRDRACVNISFGNRNQTPGNKNNVAGRTLSPDPRRHCIGTQYAALLREEAYQLRERRLAEESGKDRRPSWSRC